MMQLCGLPLALLFIAFTAPTIAQKGGAVVEVAEGAPLSVECVLRVEQRAEWSVQREGGWEPPAGELRAGGERALGEGAGLVARLSAPRALPHHAGLYRCHPAAAPVRVRLLPATPAPAAPAASPASEAVPAEAAAAAGDEVPRELLYYDLFHKLSFNCTVLDADVKYQWNKNGTAVQLDEDGELGPRLEEGGAVLSYRRASEDEHGNYTCSVAGGHVVRAWDVRARTIARMPANSNVVEGQKLSLTCKLHGRPAPRVQWRYAPPDTDVANLTLEVGEPIATEGEGARFTLKESAAGVPDGVLELAVAERSDAGVYLCAAPNGSVGYTVLRVKDVYAALWPFLGICLEVFILCAIILVYEKRRTKPEMEDSDADNHDQ